jgi:hypothetical protein
VDQGIVQTDVQVDALAKQWGEGGDVRTQVVVPDAVPLNDRLYRAAAVQAHADGVVLEDVASDVGSGEARE